MQGSDLNDFPLPGIIDFLKKVVPFNTLDPMALNEVVTAAMVAFYPAGERIIRMGEAAGGFLYIVQTGCARVTITDESGEELLGRGAVHPALRPNRQRLEEIAHQLGIKIHRRHSAVGDALATAMIFQRSLATLERRGRGRLKDLIRAGAI